MKKFMLRIKIIKQKNDLLHRPDQNNVICFKILHVKLDTDECDKKSRHGNFKLVIR